MVCGNAKYDVAQVEPESGPKAAAMLRAAGFRDADAVLLGGSTWPGEEAILLDLLVRLRPTHPDLRLVLVPRHAERRDEVLAAIARRSLRVLQRSRMPPDDAPLAGEPPDVLLVDTTGELKHLYARATAIFVGKSLTQHGGQNIIEPAVYGGAVVTGPNMENFRDVTADFLKAQAILQVPDAAGLTVAVERLLSDEPLRRALGERAAAVVARQRGAVRKTAELVLQALPAG